MNPLNIIEAQRCVSFLPDLTDDQIIVRNIDYVLTRNEII